MAVTLRKYGNKYNIIYCEFCGLSNDTKPTKTTIKGQEVNLANGSKFTEIDTGIKYIFDAENQEWNEGGD